MTRKDLVYIACILVLAVGLAWNSYETYINSVSIQIETGNGISNSHHIDHIYAQTGIPAARTLSSKERQEINDLLLKQERVP